MSQALTGLIEIGDSVLYQVVGDEIVLLNMTNQEYYGLDSVAADVWKLLMEFKRTDEVVKRLIGVYNVDPETAQEEIDRIVSELLAADLLKTLPAGTQ